MRLHFSPLFAVARGLTVASGTSRCAVPAPARSTRPGNVTVTRSVDGAVCSLGGTIISGSVGRDVVVAGGNVEIACDASVGGDVAGATGNLRIGGAVEGDLLAAAGEQANDGSVGRQRRHLLRPVDECGDVPHGRHQSSDDRGRQRTETRTSPSSAEPQPQGLRLSGQAIALVPGRRS